MTKPTPKIDPEVVEAAEAAQTPQKLGKSFAKQVEDMKAEAAPAAEILGRNVEDPFELDNLRVNQNFGDTVGVKKLLTTVPVRKPGKQEFVRVHPDPTYREILPLIDLKEDREVYVVTKRMISALAGEIIPYTLFTSITRQGVVFLWPVRLPSSDGRVIEWHRSAAEAAGRAMTKWIRVTSNMNLGAYEIFEAQGAIPNPEWPRLPYQELVRIAFRGKIIENHEHAVIKRLCGV